MAYEIRDFDLSGVRGISQRALQLHLGLYHGYVEQVNALLGILQPHEVAAPLPALDREGAVRRFPFEYNGMILHELFFEQLSGGKRRPLHETSVMAEAVDRAFGGFSAWQDDFESLAKTRGVGWVITLREPAGNAIYNTWIDEHQWGMPAGMDVVFVLDMWEHAYLLDFAPAQKPAYIQAVLDNVDWTVVESRFAIERDNNDRPHHAPARRRNNGIRV